MLSPERRLETSSLVLPSHRPLPSKPDQSLPCLRLIFGPRYFVRQTPPCTVVPLADRCSCLLPSSCLEGETLSPARGGLESAYVILVHRVRRWCARRRNTMLNCPVISFFSLDRINKKQSHSEYFTYKPSCQGIFGGHRIKAARIQFRESFANALSPHF